MVSYPWDTKDKIYCSWIYIGTDVFHCVKPISVNQRLQITVEMQSLYTYAIMYLTWTQTGPVLAHLMNVYRDAANYLIIQENIR